MARLEETIYHQLDVLPSHTLNRKETLIVIVDMINGFVREGAMADPKIANIIPAHLDLFKHLELANHLYFVDAHLSDCQEFKSFPAHCIIGTEESEIVEELKEDSLSAQVIQKNSTNGFLAPDFLNHLDQIITYDDFVITGCCSDICVLQFALTLQTYIHQYNKDKHVYVVVDAIDTYDSGDHKAESFNKISIDLLKASGVQVVKMKEGNKNESM